MDGHKAGIKSLIFSYDGKYLYSAALDGKVFKWDIAARTSMNVSTGSVEISSIDISSGGNYLAGISADGNVLVLNPDNGSKRFRIETAGRSIKVVRFNPSNNILAIGDTEGNVELWDIENHKMTSRIKAHEAQVNDIRFNTRLNQMATAGNDRKVKVFDVKDAETLLNPPITIADNGGLVLVIQFSPDGHIIISGKSEGENNLISRPVTADYLAIDMCKIISRNMTQDEWNYYVGKDIPLEKTCQVNGTIKVEPVSNK
jgi:WD40 repeat protein